MGTILHSPDKHVSLNKFSMRCGITAVSGALRGWRDYMEDFHLINKINDDVFVAGVFDGHGGPEVACYASRNIQFLIKNDAFFQLKNYHRALLNSFETLDSVINSEEGEANLRLIQKELGSKVSKNKACLGEEVGSTANVVLVTKNKIYVANIGDSRSVLCRNGKAIPLSTDHKPDNPTQKQRIRNAGGYINNGRIRSMLNISRTLGDFLFKSNKLKPMDKQMVISTPQIQEMLRTSQDQYIITASDGVWQKYGNNNQMLVDQLNKIFVQSENWEIAIQKFMVGLVPDDLKGSREFGFDNMTVVLTLLNLPTAATALVPN